MKPIGTPVHVSYRTCPLCEASCGLKVERSGDSARVTGDVHNPFSRGYMCPKGNSLIRSDSDPDRLRKPLIRDRKTGVRRPVEWDEAFQFIADGLETALKGGAPDRLAFYYGTGVSHSIASVYYPVLCSAIPTNNLFGSSTVDQAPKQIACAMMYGHPMSVPIPDIDHCRDFMIIGANPAESNGSLFTAPGLLNRLRRLRQRGGRIVVVDPVFTRTAEVADEHVAIRPAADAHFLAGMIHTLFAEELVRPGRLEEHVEGLETLRAVFSPFSPEYVSDACGIPAPVIRRLARDIAASPAAAVYGRLGSTTHAFGTLASWMIDLVNILTGNLDRRGGVMFPLAAVGQANSRRPVAKGPYPVYGPPTRVRGAPAISIVRGYERPAVTLAEEIEEPGRGQIRALITVGSNPVLTRPNGRRLARALETLDFMVSIDPYLNETTRFADIVLTSPPDHAKEHYPTIPMQWTTRNFAKWSERSRPLQPDEMCDSEIYLRLTGILKGLGAHCDPWQADDAIIANLVEDAVREDGGCLQGRDAGAILAELGDERGPGRIVDFLLRTGPFGDAFDPEQRGLTLAKLRAQAHGIDLGALQERIPQVLMTATGKIELAPPPLVDDLKRLKEPPADSRLVLIGRRHLKSNNSWMHNVDALMLGQDRWTLRIHPVDAAERGIEDGGVAIVSNMQGNIEIKVEISEDILQGVVSVPHGFGHIDPHTELNRARLSPGGNVNELVPDTIHEPLSGNAILSGIPVDVAAIPVSKGNA